MTTFLVVVAEEDAIVVACVEGLTRVTPTPATGVTRQRRNKLKHRSKRPCTTLAGNYLVLQ